MPLMNCEINVFLTRSSVFVIANSTGAGRFAITDTKHYVAVITLSTQGNAKLLRQLKSNAIIDGRNFFDQSISDDIKTYESIRKIATVQGDDYTTGFLLDYLYFKENYRMIATDLSKQQVLDDDPGAIQQINFTANLDRAGNTAMIFTVEEVKETILEFSQGTVKVL